MAGNNTNLVRVSHDDAADFFLARLDEQGMLAEAFNSKSLFLRIKHIFEYYFSDIDPDELFISDEYITPRLSDIFSSRCYKATLEILYDLDRVRKNMSDAEYREEFCYAVYFSCAFAVMGQANSLKPHLAKEGHHEIAVAG